MCGQLLTVAQICADTCLAQETLQRSKGDAKQSTLQRFASTSGGIEVGPKSAAPRQLRRSATAATISTSANEKRKARRSSSDSAMLLRNDPQAAVQHSGSDEGIEEMLPIRKLKQSSSPYPTPLQTVPSAVAAQCVSGTQQDLQAAANNTALADAVHSQLPPGSDRCMHFQTSIVGRRFRTNTTCTKHTQVALVRQPENPKDSNAIQVIDTARQAILGYLPREIAQHLSDLLDAGSVKVTATVDEPKSVAAPVPILLEVSTSCLCPEWYYHCLLMPSTLPLIPFVTFAISVYQVWAVPAVRAQCISCIKCSVSHLQSCHVTGSLAADVTCPWHQL